MLYPKCALAILMVALTCPSFAQTTPDTAAKPATPDPQAPPAAPAAAPPAPVWSVGPIDFSGLVDGYYSFNANHPISEANNLRNFDVKANQFSLNMAKLSMEHTADPIGFRVDFGFGRAFEIIHLTEQAPGVFRNIEQAYVTWKPAKAKGFQLDFGQFVTSAGAEVIETKDNWNYSRSLLFAWAIPYYHFGLRTAMPVGPHFTGGIQIVNGWNNVEDNNSGKTVGFIGNFTFKKFTWSNNYYTGPEKLNSNKGFRNLYDTTLLLTPNDKVNVYINYDYGRDKNIGPGAAVWNGVAVAAHFQTNAWFALSPRIEIFSDHNGFETGAAQRVKEFTLTGEIKMVEGLMTRMEYRRDWSNQPFFDRGATPASSKSQSTLAIGFIAFFGPKR